MGFAFTKKDETLVFLFFFSSLLLFPTQSMFSVFLLRYVVMSIFKEVLSSRNMFLMTPDLQSIPVSSLFAPGLIHCLIHPYLLSGKNLINSVMERNK